MAEQKLRAYRAKRDFSKTKEPRGAPALADFQYSGWLTEANHLGNVAYRAGKKITWNAAEMKATGLPEADKYIKREYRKGWTLEG